jgi:UDP-N-acetylglucosamine:LPS N-acetylglucosamine transferase
VSQNNAPIFDLVALISGPEPRRTEFEEVCIRIIKNNNYKSCIIRGKPAMKNRVSIDGKITFYDHLSDTELSGILKNAAKIICRSGYSTLMDLHALKLRALLVPTPGQTEQEYLAEYHAKHYDYETVKQEELENYFSGKILSGQIFNVS